MLAKISKSCKKVKDEKAKYKWKIVVIEDNKEQAE